MPKATGGPSGLCIPSLLFIVVLLLYNRADMYFVGWMGKVSTVAAASLAGPVYSLRMAVPAMLGNGTCTRITERWAAAIPAHRWGAQRVAAGVPLYPQSLS